MSNIYLRFTRTNTLVGALIRWWTNCPINHVEYYIPEGNRVISADSDGVKLKGAGLKYNPDHHYYMTGVTDPDVVKEIEKILFAEVGKPYDWKAIFSFITNHDRHSKKAWMCSELIAYAFEEVGCDWFSDNAKYQKITPRDLYLQPMLSRVEWHELPGISNVEHTV